MQRLLNTFQCEWAATLRDEEKLKRFRTFVNADDSDDNIVFVQERGQIRPARTDEKEQLIAVSNAG